MDILSDAPASLVSLRQALDIDGHARVPGARFRVLLEEAGPLSDWPSFAASWDDLPLDPYLAEGSRFRRRRHAIFAAGVGGGIERQKHGPHFQSSDYNTLFGGIERWFEPTLPAIGDGASLRTILRFCHTLFTPLAREVKRWHIETHQFRIEARADLPGQPTPEGVHRDGVDYVLVLLVCRRNIERGTTTIHAPDGTSLGSFTLTHPCDAALLDDRRVYHGVTPVQPLDPGQPAYRDVLVVTFRRA